MKRVSLAIVAGIVFLAAARLNAEIYNAADDFNLANNGAPDNIWSYGYRGADPSSTFHLFDQNGNYPYGSGYPTGDTWFQGWYHPTTSPPHIFQNVGNEDGALKTVPVIKPGNLVLHPGATGTDFSHIVVRWTAPSAGEVDLSAMFARIDVSATASSVNYIFRESDKLFEEILTGSGAGQLHTETSLSVAANDVIDFVVGPGINFSSDSTTLNAQLTFTAVPEPSTLAAMCMGLLTVALIATARRRKRTD